MSSKLGVFNKENKPWHDTWHGVRLYLKEGLLLRHAQIKQDQQRSKNSPPKPLSLQEAEQKSQHMLSEG